MSRLVLSVFFFFPSLFPYPHNLSRLLLQFCSVSGQNVSYAPFDGIFWDVMRGRPFCLPDSPSPSPPPAFCTSLESANDSSGSCRPGLPKDLLFFSTFLCNKAPRIGGCLHLSLLQFFFFSNLYLQTYLFFSLGSLTPPSGPLGNSPHQFCQPVLFPKWYFFLFAFVYHRRGGVMILSLPVSALSSISVPLESKRTPLPLCRTVFTANFPPPPPPPCPRPGVVSDFERQAKRELPPSAGVAPFLFSNHLYPW